MNCTWIIITATITFIVIYSLSATCNLVCPDIHVSGFVVGVFALIDLNTIVLFVGLQVKVALSSLTYSYTVSLITKFALQQRDPNNT